MAENMMDWLLNLEREKLDELEAKHGKIMEMTADELRAEMQGYMFGKECKRWKWILLGGGKKIEYPAFHADGTVTAESDHDEIIILRSMVNLERWYCSGRYIKAKKAARTRRLKRLAG